MSPLARNLKPPIVIKKGPRGFGFNIHTIRVYQGETDIYTLQHVVTVSVDDQFVVTVSVDDQFVVTVSVDD